MTYQWKQGRFGVDAQVAGEELERIAATRNEITAENVVDESRPEKAVLHGCFEWDDETAAERYREQQARVLIGNIVTVSIDDKKRHEQVRAYVSVQGTYKNIAEVVANIDYLDEMLYNAKKELKEFRAKYSALEQLSKLFRVIDDIVA